MTRPSSFDDQEIPKPPRPKAAEGVLPEDDRDAIERRMAEWRPYYQLQTPDEEAWFEQMIVSSVRVDLCQARESALRRDMMARAANFWEVDRRNEAEALGASISRRPGYTRGRLEETRQGADWLIERWRGLARVLERKGTWSEAQARLALDLAGTSRVYRDSTPEIDDPAALVAREIAGLQDIKARFLDDRDERERQAALSGFNFLLSREWGQLHRYEQACHRHFEEASKKLRWCRRTPRPSDSK